MEGILKHKDENQDYPYITYSKLFWLFIAGSISGVLIEGIYTLFAKGHWESHVVSVFGAFNILYGAGAVLFYVGAVKLRDKHMYIRVFCMTIVATLLELVSGLLLRYGLGMRAWNYDRYFFNYKGLICLNFSIIWGIAAFVMCVVYPYVDKMLSKLHGKYWRIACRIMSVVMIINIMLTCVYLVRWSERHYGIATNSKFAQEIDWQAPDEWMQERFIEWRFLE